MCDHQHVLTERQYIIVLIIVLYNCMFYASQTFIKSLLNLESVLCFHLMTNDYFLTFHVCTSPHTPVVNKICSISPNSSDVRTIRYNMYIHT